MGTSSSRVLILDPDGTITAYLSEVLGHGWKALSLERCADPNELQRVARPGAFALLVLNGSLPPRSGIAYLSKLRKRIAATPILLLHSHDLDPSTLGPLDPVHALRKPFRSEELRAVLESVLTEDRSSAPAGPASEAALQGMSPKFLAALDMVRTVAPTDATILLVGQSGSGKSTMARLIHDESPRRARRFEQISCAGLPETLIESELFGYEKGAFSAAFASKPGLFEVADGGTVFLDEVPNLSPGGQVKLLQVLQERTFRRVGGTETRATDVRIIAAASENLERLVAQGNFREDLYYRLNVVTIELPSLAERREDVPTLIDAVLREFSRKHRKGNPTLSPQAHAILMQHSWPGNLRELRNAIERMVLLAKGPVLGPELLPPSITNGNGDGSGHGRPARRTRKSRYTRDQVLRACEEAKGDRSQAQDILKVSRAQYYRLLKQFGLS